ncbi:hypothetical protein [Synechococcus sp. PCC 6312]|uniref:hypothetical protein n=1 Tax=Synechococcus sp. (strain ATCC 27167 / PCC 6312) TaxID=195253 RepID=UPI00029F44C0|nr:hypothetical protein [Synechococcus sp. PCC 6312]AFY61566.1 hypothetical protein Syn6312_2465 [Synechococcus sp. PCC 6312]
MKATLISLIPPTLLTVLIAATAALRFYDATDLPPTFPQTPSDNGASGYSSPPSGWLWWILALGGGLDIWQRLKETEREMEKLDKLNSKLDAIWQSSPSSPIPRNSTAPD